MAGFRKELNALDTSFMALKRMDPFFGDKTIMFFISEVWWGLDETLTRSWHDLVSISMVNWCHSCLWCIFLISLFYVLNALLPLFFIFFHQLFLFFSQICLLTFKIFHSFIRCPRSLEISTGSVSKFLPFQLHFTSFSFFRHLRMLFFRPSSNKDCWSNSCAICWVKSYTFIFKTVELLTKLGRIKLGSLQKSGEMILLGVNFCFSCKSSDLFLLFRQLHLSDIHFRRQCLNFHRCLKFLGKDICIWLQLSLAAFWLIFFIRRVLVFIQ